MQRLFKRRFVKAETLDGDPCLDGVNIVSMEGCKNFPLKITLYLTRLYYFLEFIIRR